MFMTNSSPIHPAKQIRQISTSAITDAVFPKASEVSEAELGEYMLGLKTMTEKDMEGLL